MEVIKFARVPAATLPPTASVYEAVTFMAANQVGAVVIVNDHQQVIGIFTERDNLLRVAAHRRNLDDTKISEVMTAPVESIPPETDVQGALERMVRRHFRHLPIVDAENRILGIVSVRYLLMRRMGEQQNSLDVLSAYVEAGGPG